MSIYFWLYTLSYIQEIILESYYFSLFTQIFYDIWNKYGILESYSKYIGIYSSQELEKYLYKMLNYKFSSLLEDTPLTAEDKYNLSVIFVAMKSERQLDIIECWPSYLDRIIHLHTEAENNKKIQLQETFSKINQIINTTKLKK